MSFIRIYDETDDVRIQGFLAANRSALNLGRRHALSNGADCHWLAAERDDGGIVAVGAIFRWGEDYAYREAGAARVVLNGYGIHRVLMLSRIVHECIALPGFSTFYCSTLEVNAASLRLFASLGLSPWPDPPNTLRERRVILPDTVGPLLFFRIPTNKLALYARELLELEHKGMLPAKHGGEPLAMALDIDVLRNRHDAVVRLALGEDAMTA